MDNTGRRHQRDKLIPQLWYKYVRVEVLVIALDYTTNPWVPRMVRLGW